MFCGLPIFWREYEVERIGKWPLGVEDCSEIVDGTVMQQQQDRCLLDMPFFFYRLIKLRYGGKKSSLLFVVLHFQYE